MKEYFNFLVVRFSNKKYPIIFFIFISSFLSIHSQVGINTIDPKAFLDINGDMRVQDVSLSTSTNDDVLVIDENGLVKRSLINESTFRAYLNTDFVTDNAEGTYHIINFNAIENPKNDFDLTNNIFTAPLTGLYNIRITITAKPNIDTTIPRKNGVYGLAKIIGANPDLINDDWVIRFSFPLTNIQALASTTTAGIANSYIGVVQLDKDERYYFGTTGYLTLLAEPSGNTGKGIGSYFEIQLIKTL